MKQDTRGMAGDVSLSKSVMTQKVINWRTAKSGVDHTNRAKQLMRSRTFLRQSIGYTKNCAVNLPLGSIVFKRSRALRLSQSLDLQFIIVKLCKKSAASRAVRRDLSVTRSAFAACIRFQSTHSFVDTSSVRLAFVLLAGEYENMSSNWATVPYVVWLGVRDTRTWRLCRNQRMLA